MVWNHFPGGLFGVAAVGGELDWDGDDDGLLAKAPCIVGNLVPAVGGELDWDGDDSGLANASCIVSNLALAVGGGGLLVCGGDDGLVVGARLFWMFILGLIVLLNALLQMGDGSV